MLMLFSLIRAKFGDNGLTTKVHGQDLTVTQRDIHNHLGLSLHSIDLETYMWEHHLEAFRSLAKTSCRHFTTDLKKGYLKCKYSLLFDIMVKVMFGERKSMDSLSQRRLCALKAIGDGVACD